MYEIKHYIDSGGKDPFADWRERVKDSRIRIAKTVAFIVLSSAIWEIINHAEKAYGSYELT